MADPTTIIAITSISAVSIGIITKLLIVCRKNIRNCWGIQFRSPTNSVQDKSEIEMATTNHHQVSPRIIIPNLEQFKAICDNQHNHDIHITPHVLNEITSNGRNLV